MVRLFLDQIFEFSVVIIVRSRIFSLFRFIVWLRFMVENRRFWVI